MLQNYHFIFSIHFLVTLCSLGLFAIVVVVLLTHIISNFIFSKRSSVNLSHTSFVVITGGCMGLGKQMALQISKLYHCTILIVDIRKDLFNQVNQQISQFGSTCQFYCCDLADQTSVAQFISFLNQRKQKIDLFIHNAGIIIPKKALQTSQKQFMMQYRVNFLSPVRIIKQTIYLMQNGHIGVVASMVALAHGGIDVSAYSSSKHSLYSFINCMRQQLKSQKKSITISMGCPYLIKTQMFEGFKTKLDFLFRTMNPQYVGKRLIKQFIQKKQICYVYQYEAILFKVVSFLPTFFLDYLSINFNVSDFTIIKNKHNTRIKEMK